MKVLHFNDHHGYLDESSMKLNIEGVGKTYVKMGGLPRMTALIKKLRTDNTLTLSAGDAFSGTLYHTLFHGLANVDLMNDMGLDAFTLGNHEFDNRDEGLKAFIDKAKFPVVSANVVPDKGNILEGAWKPYIIKEIDGAKVGIIGIDIAQKTKVSSRPSDQIKFLDEVTTAQKYANELKAKGVNKIILLSHYGYDNDVALAKKVSGIDVIIDGDSHTLMGDFSKIGLTSQVPEYPTKLKSKDGEPVCIAQAWAHALALGELDVSLDENGLVTKCEGTTHVMLGDSFCQKNAEGKKVDVNETTKAKIKSLVAESKNIDIVAQDSELQAKLEEYKKLVDAKKNNPIGTAAEDLKHIRIPGHTYGGVDGATMPLGSDIAPVVAKGFYLASKRADACIQNAGGVRISIPSGDVTYGDAYTLLPFSNTLFEIDMKGSEIKAVLEDALSNYLDNGGSTGSFPYAYALRYDIDASQPKGSRVSNLEIMDRETKTWSLIDNTKTYVIVTNNYIAEGRDGYATFKTVQDSGTKAVDTQLDYAESFVNYVKELKKEDKALQKLPTEEHCIKSYKE